GCPFFFGLHPLGTVEDITERVQAEEERAALIARLEAQNAELERFTYTISHDLKSPLITIQGFLGLLLQDVASGNVEQMRRDATFISDAVQKMEQLLNELLALSRIGRVVNPPRETPVGELVREALDMVAGQLQGQGVRVEIAPELLKAHGGPTVYGDRARLREVWQNLVDNAVKYMGDQPEPRVEIGMRCDGDEKVFYVRDNGIGIDPRHHDKVFGLFNKLDPQTEGTGVGLAIVKRIVEVHGGCVWVESEGAGQGSTFCFTLVGKQG
ncbi:MAG: ATP-binding protein, partial [Anaerolineae bacterium]